MAKFTVAGPFQRHLGGDWPSKARRVVASLLQLASPVRIIYPKFCLFAWVGPPRWRQRSTASEDRFISDEPPDRGFWLDVLALGGETLLRGVARGGLPRRIYATTATTTTTANIS